MLNSKTLWWFNRDRLLVWGLRLCATLSGAIALLIVGFLLRESWPLLQAVNPLRFVGDPSWHPTQQRYNLTPMLVGTVVVALGAIAVAAPLGLLSALFCQYYAPPLLGKLYRRLIELLVGVPSIVYGFWGLVVLVPLINRWHPPGTSVLAGVAILAVMILPTVALTADASFTKVPPQYLQGAAALALSRWRTIFQIALPAARPGVLTGILLATGRALGETMAVLMVCGNVVQLPGSVFDPVRTLTANIALEMAYATENHRSALFVSGLVLMGAVILLVALTELASKGAADG